MNPPDRLGPGPGPFELTQQQLRPLLFACGFRLAEMAYPDRQSRHAFAEYHRPGLRLRLVWEGVEQVLWIEAARQAGVYPISRWTDIEWAVSGRRLPLNYDTGENRIRQLIAAVKRFLEQDLGGRPAPPLRARGAGASEEAT